MATLHSQVPKVLVVEDLASLAELYCAHLASAGFQAQRTDSARGAGAAMQSGGFDAMLLDIGLPDGDGMAILKDARRRYPRLAVIMVTANASINKAVEAVREGAFEYLVKPVTREKLVGAVTNALKARMQTTRSEQPSAGGAGIAGFVGSSPAMERLYAVIRSVAQSKAAVFITGESGTGKELCAEAVHRMSPRGAGPFIAINCGAIPKDLIESEVFGHIKGSFTGAIADREGAARLANGGTLFLDEICEMDPALQPKLLRFLQTGTIQRVGSTQPEKIDVRIVCATNRDPAAEVKAGRFREDLFYRLHVLPVHLPPLRARGADIIELAAHFLLEAAEEEGKDFAAIAPGAESRLLACGWPGNVRQLQNAIRHAVVLHSGAILESHMLPDAPGAVPLAFNLDLAGLARGPAHGELWQIERDAIEVMISKCGGSIPKAARMLGVSPSTIYRKRDAWQAVARN
jgi:two-component system, repressor protein LuxO